VKLDQIFSGRAASGYVENEPFFSHIEQCSCTGKLHQS